MSPSSARRRSWRHNRRTFVKLVSLPRELAPFSRTTVVAFKRVLSDKIKRQIAVCTQLIYKPSKIDALSIGQDHHTHIR